MAQSIPTQHTAGDTFAARLQHIDHPPADGWVASLQIIGDAERYTVATTADGDAHAATATATTTAAWCAGRYQLVAIYTQAASSSRSSYPVGTLRVLPDPAAVGTLAASLKGPARQAYDDLMAAYRAYLSAGRWTVQEYLIAGRRMTFRALPELLAAIDRAKRDAEAEATADRIAAGESPRRRFVVRM